MFEFLQAKSVVEFTALVSVYFCFVSWFCMAPLSRKTLCTAFYVNIHQKKNHRKCWFSGTNRPKMKPGGQRVFSFSCPLYFKFIFIEYIRLYNIYLLCIIKNSLKEELIVYLNFPLFWFHLVQTFLAGINSSTLTFEYILVSDIVYRLL